MFVSSVLFNATQLMQDHSMSYYPQLVGSVVGLTRVSMPAQHAYEPKDNLRLLQDKVDAIQSHQRLSVYPPRPLESYSIQPEAVEDWISSLPDESQKKAARTFSRVTEHITQYEFELELQRSVGQFNQWLNTQASQDYIILTSDKGERKSNLWVTELALPYLQTLPKAVFSFNYLDSQDVAMHLNEYLDQEASTAIFFDDATYSCSQSKMKMKELEDLPRVAECQYSNKDCSSQRVKEIKAAKQNRTFAAIIPFMADSQCLNLGDHTQTFTSRRLHTLEESLALEEIESLECEPNHVSAYFDHKIADFVSVCEGIYRKIVGVIVPPYKK